MKVQMKSDDQAVEYAKAVTVLSQFICVSQLQTIEANCRGEEKEFFITKCIELSQQIQSMPVTYDQDGEGDSAIAHLHYFHGGSDWYITEKDVDGGVKQAFGYAILNGDIENAEWGYISISELLNCGIELDLYFAPVEVKALLKDRRSA